MPLMCLLSHAGNQTRIMPKVERYDSITCQIPASTPSTVQHAVTLCFRVRERRREKMFVPKRIFTRTHAGCGAQKHLYYSIITQILYPRRKLSATHTTHIVVDTHSSMPDSCRRSGEYIIRHLAYVRTSNTYRPTDDNLVSQAGSIRTGSWYF